MATKSAGTSSATIRQNMQSSITATVLSEAQAAEPERSRPAPDTADRDLPDRRAQRDTSM
jgi:hypothetical protein